MEIVELTQNDLAYIKEYAAAREAQNVGQEDAGTYQNKAGLPLNSVQAGRRGLAGEWGFLLWLGVDPHQHAWVIERDGNGKYPKSLKAQGDWIIGDQVVEVRNLIYMGTAPAVKQKDLMADALMVYTHLEVIEGKPTGRLFLLGWTPARDIKAAGYQFDSRGLMRFPSLSLKPMSRFPKAVPA